ncbi:MAG: hypothetical protein WCS32_06690, partial [Candidatus Izemoplasmatales bacterium]
MKKRRVFSKGTYLVHIPEVDEVAYQSFENEVEVYHGIFNLGLLEGKIKVDVPDGKYRNYLNNKYIKVKDQEIKLSKEPIIFRIKK